MSLAALASGSNLAFRHYTTDNGLPSNCVRDIMQDSRGFIWFATDGGLVRFDGQRFRVFSLSKVEGKHFQDDFVSSMHELDGKIWIGVDTQLFYYDPETEKILAPELHYAPACTSRIDSYVRDMTSDKDGNLWLAVAGNGVFKVNSVTGDVVNYEFPQLSNMVGRIYVDSRNDVWVMGNQGRGILFKLNKSDDTFKPLQLKLDGRPLHVIAVAMVEDEAHNMWIGMWDSGLYRFDPFTGEAYAALQPGADRGLVHIHSITAGSNDALFIGSDAGLTVFNPKSGEYTLYKNDELDRRSLSDQFVYPILRDREDGMWIGTFYGGVNYLAPDLKQFNAHRHSRFVNSVSGDIISGFCEDGMGNVWIASDDGGLCYYTPSTGRYSHVALPSTGAVPFNNNVHALCLDGDDLWIGTYTTGVGVYNIKTHLMRHYYPREDDDSSLDGWSSYAIYRDRDRNIWVSTMDMINLYDREADNFKRVRSLGAMTIDIDQDVLGNLWFSTQGKGLFRYDTRHRVWKNYRFSGDEGALPHNHVNCTTIDSRGRMWVATANGLCRYVPERDSFEIINIGDVPSKTVFSVIEDQNSLWLTTSNGLVRYSLVDGSSELFTTFDGLSNNQFMLNAGLKTSSGCIYLGTIKGLNSFYPYQIRPNQAMPPVAFTELDVVNSVVEVGDSRLPKSLNSVERIELSHEDYLFSLSFSALSYVNPSKNHLRYKLEGFDKTWINAGSDNRATYTNLPPGNYRMMVQASNNDNLWNEDGITLHIKILPPWYASIPMKILYVLLALGLIFLLIRLLLRYYDKQHKVELSRVSANKEKEVYQAKMSFFTMIAHEIRTPVSLIIGPLEKIMRSPGELSPTVRDDLNIINRNSQRLLFLVNQLLDFKKVEQNGFTVQFSRQNVTNLVTAVAERFAPSIEQMGGKLVVEQCERDIEADVDAEALTKLVSNLLNNARKYMKDRIVIACHADEGQGWFTISVSDNGVGISRDNQEKIFKPFFQVMDDNRESKGGTGLGLSIVQSVVEAHKGEIKVESSLGNGATFIVTLPLRQEGVTASAGNDIMSPAEDKGCSRAIDGGVNDVSRPVMLIVDDNEEMLQFITSNFNSDYEVVTAVNGKEALDKLSRHEVALIVSDWMMPVMNGVELCRAVRSNCNYSHIPFILLTAKTDNYSKIEGLNCGADAYVEKPFSVNYLEARIHNLVEMRKLLREKFSQTPLEPINTIAPNPVDDQFLTQLTNIIEENFSNPELSVDFLANRMGISRSGLYAKIKTLANVTPNELIQLTRLKKAAKLLAENKYRINEICYMVGFNSSSYFSKCFQRQFGIKPGEFTPHSL